MLGTKEEELFWFELLEIKDEEFVKLDKLPTIPATSRFTTFKIIVL